MRYITNLYKYAVLNRIIHMYSTVLSLVVGSSGKYSHKLLVVAITNFSYFSVKIFNLFTH